MESNKINQYCDIKQLYSKYGKVKIKKGTTLYHWSKNNNINIFNQNSFFCLDNNSSSIFGKYLYTFILKKDIELLFTLSNIDFDENKDNNEFNTTCFRSRDIEKLTEINNILIPQNMFKDDVNLKKNKQCFNNLCEILSSHTDGFFNCIECKTQFEIVIFDVKNTIEKKDKPIDKKDFKNFHTKTQQRNKIINNKIHFEYPIIFTMQHNKNDTFCEKKYLKKCYEPSIFYYIYVKNNIRK